jgi:hypothetical protein
VRSALRAMEILPKPSCISAPRIPRPRR